MIFKTIPKNGASWLKPLLYSLEFDQREEQVEVEICDLLTSAQLGRFILYNTTSAEVDIAPYIRSSRLSAPLAKQSSIIEFSPDACRVVLRAKGEESEPIVVFRSDVGGQSPRMLSSLSESGTVAVGEHIRFTLLANSTINLTVAHPSDGGIKRINFATNGLPCEVDVPIASASVGERIILRVECDGELVGVYNYRVVERDESAVCLAWVNSIGGIECCTFPQSVRRSVAVKSEDVEGECGWYRRIVGSTIVRRVTMLGATQSEVDGILDILLSPKVYRCDSGNDVAVQLLTDTVTYDEHGRLRRLEFDIKEEWKGGVL